MHEVSGCIIEQQWLKLILTLDAKSLLDLLRFRQLQKMTNQRCRVGGQVVVALLPGKSQSALQRTLLCRHAKRASVCILVNCVPCLCANARTALTLTVRRVDQGNLEACQAVVN